MVMTLQDAEQMMDIAAQDMHRKERLARATLHRADADLKRARLQEWAVATREFNRWRQAVAAIEKSVKLA